ncbi:sensor histidine kinase [Rhodopseudomonas sp. P1]|uniref:sensor histidine kinase n=1 Tax=Rhodopseudomonas sp. P1 TaxID=3434357 RepID=UPI0031FCA10A
MVPSPDGEAEKYPSLCLVDRPHPGRVIIDGADPTIDRETAKGLRLALHEMTTNALKYGALSEEKGRIIVRSQIGEGGCKIEWLEQDGPKVTAPAKFNFGPRLIKQSLAQINASLDAEYADDGYRYVIMLPTNDQTKGRY